MADKKYLVKNGLMYNKAHQWVKEEGNVVSFGLTDYAAKELGDISLVSLDAAKGLGVVQVVFAGDEVKSAAIADVSIESSKTVADIYAPVSGTVKAVNDALSDSPEMINSKPYDAWLMKIQASAWEKEKTALMDANTYKAFVVKVAKVADANVELK